MYDIKIIHSRNICLVSHAFITGDNLTAVQIVPHTFYVIILKELSQSVLILKNFPNLHIWCLQSVSIFSILDHPLWFIIVIISVMFFYLRTLLFSGPGGWREYSQKNWVGVCGPLPKNPTLFMAKICDIPYPNYDLTKNSKPNL